jgi:UDP-N-acetylglucosamine/UDP-N-acetylgalactosamine diphosphorylase
MKPVPFDVDNEAALREYLAAFGQEHVLRWWPELDAEQRQRLACQVAGIDLAQLRALYEQATAAGGLAPVALDVSVLRPAPVLRLASSFEDWERDQRAAERGDEALFAGQVAVLCVAGGQGSRLGFRGPKGTFPIGPLSGKSLFQLHAEKVLALGRRYEKPLPFCIMTSPENDEATRAFFAAHGHFGLDPEQVIFFTQGVMPAVDRETGRLLLAGKDRLALSPNGHGGVLQALADGGHLAALARRGVRQLFYFQVDNPLVKIADPAYLGYHLDAGAEMSLKVVAKNDPYEKVGTVVQEGEAPAELGRLRVIEYSDLPDELAAQRTPDGELVFWAGSIAIHLFDLAFLDRLAQNAAMLPFHRAVKRVPYLDDDGVLVMPAEPNAIKFEMFIFDALPLARRALAVETDRREEFEPLKNAAGENSPATVRQALANLYAGWLRNAGVEVARRPDGSAAVPVEISPLYALDAAELRARLARTEREPVTAPLLLDTPPAEPPEPETAG